MAEWLKALVLKTSEGASLPWVRRTGGEAIRLTLEGGGFAAEYYAMRAVPVEYNTGDGTQQGGAMVLEQRPAQKPDYASLPDSVRHRRRSFISVRMRQQTVLP